MLVGLGSSSENTVFVALLGFKVWGLGMCSAGLRM